MLEGGAGGTLTAGGRCGLYASSRTCTAASFLKRCFLENSVVMEDSTCFMRQVRHAVGCSKCASLEDMKIDNI